MFHLQSPLYISFKVPRQGTSSRFPYAEKDIAFPEPSLPIFQRPQKRNTPPGSLYGAPTPRKMLHFQSPLYLSFKVPRKETPLQVLLMEPLHRKRCSNSRALFRYLSKSPEKVSASRFPSQNPIEREMLHLQSTL
jgi:hypothetical protein